MKNLLRYYDREPDVILLVLNIYPRNLKELKDASVYTEERFVRAVESDPRGALSVLASCLGVNWAVFEESMIEWEQKEEEWRRKKEVNSQDTRRGIVKYYDPVMITELSNAQYLP